ncbi:hypothetical protein B0H16DRAFT_1499319 [Mycena metata]|uniref:FAD dependent oxidoreductase domain-containing protein n=1 Tax=Mycena metata TaxID=1033252 RepID=A0AAD7NXQ7_9AGAR|nr:hypothetical protein B0H16DRAFT_1499319 [Mycena metata]
MKQQSVFVVGAGVVGLSTAIRVLEAGYDVTLFAEVFPTDPKTVKYTSFWAGAICRPGLGNSLSSRLEKETLHIFAQMVKEDPNVPIATHPIFGYAEVANPEDRKHDAEMKELFPDFRVLDPNELPHGVASGVVFTVFFIDVPQYLAYLWHRFFFLGGRAFRSKLSSLSDLLSPTTGVRLGLEHVARDGNITEATSGSLTFNASALVNCTGLGALSLGDVNDAAMFPTRGETVLLRAPWITSGLQYAWKNGDITYIIPRGSGVVVLGGTFQADDWHPSPRPEMVKLMKEHGIAVCRELLPPSKRAHGGIDDLDVIEECVGLRPTRRGGVRVQTSWLDGEKKIPVVHNYGHGGGGYESSWASADLAVELLQTALKG